MVWNINILFSNAGHGLSICKKVAQNIDIDTSNKINIASLHHLLSSVIYFPMFGQLFKTQKASITKSTEIWGV